jgi:hypothetical protein
MCAWELQEHGWEQKDMARAHGIPEDAASATSRGSSDRESTATSAVAGSVDQQCSVLRLSRRGRNRCERGSEDHAPMRSPRSSGSWESPPSRTHTASTTAYPQSDAPRWQALASMESTPRGLDAAHVSRADTCVLSRCAPSPDACASCQGMGGHRLRPSPVYRPRWLCSFGLSVWINKGKTYEQQDAILVLHARGEWSFCPVCARITAIFFTPGCAGQTGCAGGCRCCGVYASVGTGCTVNQPFGNYYAGHSSDTDADTGTCTFG